MPEAEDGGEDGQHGGGEQSAGRQPEDSLEVDYISDSEARETAAAAAKDAEQHQQALMMDSYSDDYRELREDQAKQLEKLEQKKKKVKQAAAKQKKLQPVAGKKPDAQPVAEERPDTQPGAAEMQALDRIKALEEDNARMRAEAGRRTQAELDAKLALERVARMEKQLAEKLASATPSPESVPRSRDSAGIEVAGVKKIASSPDKKDKKRKKKKKKAKKGSSSSELSSDEEESPKSRKRRKKLDRKVQELEARLLQTDAQLAQALGNKQTKAQLPQPLLCEEVHQEPDMSDQDNWLKGTFHICDDGQTPERLNWEVRLRLLPPNSDPAKWWRADLVPDEVARPVRGTSFYVQHLCGAGATFCNPQVVAALHRRQTFFTINMLLRKNSGYVGLRSQTLTVSEGSTSKGLHVGVQKKWKEVESMQELMEAIFNLDIIGE